MVGLGRRELAAGAAAVAVAGWAARAGARTLSSLLERFDARALEAIASLWELHARVDQLPPARAVEAFGALRAEVFGAAAPRALAGAGVG